MRLPVDLSAWKSLQAHAAATRDLQMRDLFAKDPNRGETLSLRWNDIHAWSPSCPNSLTSTRKSLPANSSR